MAQKPNHQIDFIISTTATAEVPSFNPLDSDRLLNAIHLEQMVGTLVRLSPEGRYEGYLAKSWNNNNGRVWEFQIKPNLYCEDGTPINASTTKKSFEQIIHLISKHSSMPIINELNGYNEFIEGAKNISGIEAIDSYTLKFSFTRPVTSGFLEYLGLPYLGFYCEKNFKADGTWKNNLNIISSGSYRMMPWNKIGPIQLKIRPDWPLASSSAPQVVTVHRNQFKADELDKYQNPFILSQNLTEDQKSPELTLINSIPSIFHGIVISNKCTPFLNSEVNRAIIKEKIHKKRETRFLPYTEIADQFYPHMSEKIKLIQSEQHLIGLPVRPLKIMYTNKGQPHRDYAIQLIIESLTDLNIPFEIIEVQNSNKNMMNEQRNLTKYDFKSVSVDVGGGIENQLIKFMFCSNLGVSFPDPSGKICQLVENYESLYGDSIPKNELKNYIRTFDQIIEKDSAVVPLFKTGHHWLLHKNIDSSSFSPTMGLPYFDLINFK